MRVSQIELITLISEHIKWLLKEKMHFISTVDSRYLEIQGAL